MTKRKKKLNNRKTKATKLSSRSKSLPYQERSGQSLATSKKEEVSLTRVLLSNWGRSTYLWLAACRITTVSHWPPKISA